MLGESVAFVSVTALHHPAGAGRQAGAGRLASQIHHSQGGLAMKQNVRRIVLLSAALALVGALVLSSAVFARGPEGAGTTPNQPVSQQQVQAQNQVQVQQQEQVQQQAQAQNTGAATGSGAEPGAGAATGSSAEPGAGAAAGSSAESGTGAATGSSAEPGTGAAAGSGAEPDAAQRQAQAQNQLQVQSTAGPGQQHPCSDCDGSQAQEGKACQNGNIYGPGYGTGPIGCGLFGPGPYEKCLDQDGICDCREWKGGFQ